MRESFNGLAYRCHSCNILIEIREKINTLREAFEALNTEDIEGLKRDYAILDANKMVSINL